VIVRNKFLLFFFVLFFGFNFHLEAAQLKLAATILPVSDMVKEIAGENNPVITILPPGANPHTFELNPRIIKELDGSSIIFVIGKSLDDWIASASENLSGTKLVQLTEGIQLIDNDPHYWLSVGNAKRMVKTIADTLIGIDGAHKDKYEANLKRYLGELNQADLHIKKELRNLQNKKMITFHDGWRYFARDYGLEVVGTIESSEGSEPTPRRLAELGKTIRRHRLKVLFTEPTVSKSLAESLAHDFNLRLIELDPLGIREENKTFIQLMLHNADEIEEGLSNE